MAAGRHPASSRRMTRWVSTWVLPEPALADTQAELEGSEASRCRALVQSIQLSGVSAAGPASRGSIVIAISRFCR